MNRFLLIALAACTVAGVADGVSTVLCINAVHSTAVEANPFARMLIEILGMGPGILVQKILAVALTVFVASRICHERSTGAWLALWGLALLQAIAAISNTYQLLNLPIL